MNQKTLLLLAVAIPMVIMGAGCSTLNKDTQTSQTPVTPAANVVPIATTNEFKFSDLKVGLEIAGLKVTSFGPYYAREPMSTNNLTINFEGTKTVAGVYSGTKVTGMGGPASFILDEASAKILPRLTPEDVRSKWFSFNGNQVDVVAKLGTVKKPATIVIKNYTLNIWPAEVSDMADLVEVKETVPAKQAGADMTGWKTVITYPTNGSVIEGRTVKIKGKTQPNYLLWAYINSPSSERLGANSYANGGAGKADANGNFSFDLAEPCSHNLTVVVVAVSEKDSHKEYWDVNDLSKPVSFTTTGTLPGVCKQVETSSKKYENSKYHFSLLLPKSWGNIVESKGDNIGKEINTTKSWRYLGGYVSDIPNRVKLFDSIRFVAENDPQRFIQIQIVEKKEPMRVSAYDFYYISSEFQGQDEGSGMSAEDQKIKAEISSIVKSFSLTY